MGVRLRVLVPLFVLAAMPLQRAAAAEEEMEASESPAEPEREDMHLWRFTPGPAAAAGLPALLAMSAAYAAFRRRRRPPS